MRRIMHLVLAISPAWRWAIWSAYTLAWTTALLVPPPPLPEVPERAEEAYRWGLFLFAKTVHVSANAVWAAMTCWLPVGRSSRAVLFGVLALQAIGTEYSQWFMDIGRHGSVRDVALDWAGVGLGVLACLWLRHRGFTRPPAPAEPAELLEPPDRGLAESNPRSARAR